MKGNIYLRLNFLRSFSNFYLYFVNITIISTKVSLSHYHKYVQHSIKVTWNNSHLFIMKRLTICIFEFYRWSWQTFSFLFLNRRDSNTNTSPFHWRIMWMIIWSMDHLHIPFTFFTNICGWHIFCFVHS